MPFKQGAVVAVRRFTVILLTARARVCGAGYIQLGAGMTLIAVGGSPREIDCVASPASAFNGAAA
jgi:hypothetical protein